MNISVAIPIYQQANLLPYALKSIQAQKANVQLSLMDATPDDSVTNVLKYYKNTLDYHRHGSDSGQTSAIQEGWDNTDGEIIAWLCADDYYFPDTLKTVEEFFSDNPHIDVIYGDSVFVNEQNHFTGYFPSIKTDLSYITKECCISQPSCFVRRSAFKKIGGTLNKNLHYIMDWDLWTRLYHSGAKFYYLNKPLSVVRMYENTKTSSRSWRRFFEISRHLFLNTNPISAIRSLIGFHYQDLLINQPKGIDRITLKLINSYRTQKEKYSKKETHVNFSYGFKNKGNLVDPDIDIHFPWYEDSPPTRILVNCDLNTAPTAHLNGMQLHDNIGQNFCYDLPKINTSTYLLHLKLSSPKNKSWHLYSVQFLQ